MPSELVRLRGLCAGGDETGARICSAVYRKDAQAIREGAVLMSNSMLEPRQRLLVSLLASTYYFPLPSHAFILRIVGLAQGSRQG